MIINGGARRNAQFFAKHLTNKRDNDRVTLCEMRNFLTHSIPEAFREMEAIALGSQCQNYFYHANVNPQADSTLDEQQWQHAVNLLERNLDLMGHARFVVEHEKKRRIHRHVIWLRINVSTMRTVDMTDDFSKHQATSRELEKDFGHDACRSVIGASDSTGPCPPRRPKSWESFRGQTSGLDPHLMTKAITMLYRASVDGLDFAAGLNDYGYRLGKGDRQDFCIIDAAGHVHSLMRRLESVSKADLRAFLASLPPAAIPPLAEVLSNKSW